MIIEIEIPLPKSIIPKSNIKEGNIKIPNKIKTL